MKIVYLTPKAAFRNSLRSDSLFGLLIWGIREIHGLDRVEEIIQGFVEGKPPFILSSAFPFRTDEGKRSLFFPKPVIKPMRLQATPEVMVKYKDYKKILWLPEEIFSQFVKGELSGGDFFTGNLWEKIKNPLPKSVPVMHNTIDRIKGSSIELFYTEEYFIRNGGLFFLMDLNDPVLEEQLTGVFQFFEHIGFGGDASVGKAAFKFEVEDYQPEWLMNEAPQKMTLSLYFPRQDELDFYSEHERDTWYRLELRKGRVGGRLHIQSNVWKNSVTVFKEGSVFPSIPQKTMYGGFPIVKPKKKAQRFNVHYYGYPLMIGFNMKGN